ncbi:hypothetical protein [Pseudomonas capeferrum]
MIASRNVNPLHQWPLNAAPEPPTIRRPRLADRQSNPAAPHAADRTQVEGDSELAGYLAQTLRTAASTGRLGDIDHLPPASAFGQWWSHLHDLMKSPHFVSWAKRQQIDLSKPIEINPRDNLISAFVGGQRKPFSGFEHGHLWTSMMAPIMRAAKALTSDSGYILSPSSSTSAPYRAVADFYGEAITGQTRESAEARAAQLEAAKAFNLSRSRPERSAQVLEHERAKLANAHDHSKVALKLIAIIQEIDDLSEQWLYRTTKDPLDSLYLPPAYVQSRIEQLIRDKMSSTHITLHADSPIRLLQAAPTVSLDTHLSDNGWDRPRSRDELFNLGRLLTTPALSQLPDGNLGGALSWPTPLSDDDCHNLRNSLRQNTLGLNGLQDYDEGTGALGYLTRNQRFAPSELHDPRRFIQSLLATPDAQALGLALQEKFNGVSTPQSLNDWTLAALGATLDKEPEAANTWAPARTGVAGFDMAGHQHWGQHPSTVVAGLVTHLVSTGRASAELAPVAAHLLLSRRAPAFLVNDIPDKVTCGSHTWVSFSTAVARLERQAPGSTARMTFAQVMQRADLAPVTDQDRQVERRAQRDALKDWGVAQGLIALNTLDDYTDEQMNRVSGAYSARISALGQASQAHSTAMPERREMALKELERVYGDLPFEKKCITPLDQSRDFPGPYSVLDLYLHGQLEATAWTSSSGEVDTRTIAGHVNKLSDINALFNTELQRYFHAAEQATSTHVKHLIATLPLEDRKAIEYGKVTLLTERSVTHTAYSQSRVETKVPNSLLLKTELDGVVTVYEVNVRDNSIRRREELKDHPIGRQTNEADKWRYSKMLLEVKPSGRYSPHVAEENHRAGTPDSFASERTRYIADALVQDLNIRALETEARGVTTFDTEVPFYKKAREFMLNLIPLRSAIQNFRAGAVGDGILDLAFDAFGFVVGLGVAAKGAKALQAGTSAAARLAQGVKIVGRAALGALNPLDGVGSLISRTARGVQKGGLHAYNTLRGSADSYSLIHASRHFEASAVGTFKLGGAIAEGPAVLQRGKWFAFDTLSGQPYGKALEDFQPSIRASGELHEAQQTAGASAWTAWVEQQKNGADSVQFNHGYTQVDPLTISGYHAGMKSAEVMALARAPGRTPAEVGALVRQRERLAVQHSFSGVNAFYQHISVGGGTFTPVPQLFYLSQTTPLSKGQCAAMSRVMATAMEQGKHTRFAANLFSAAANPTAAESRQFVANLTHIQKQLDTPTQFHASAPVRKMGYAQLMDEIADASAPKIMMIGTADHAMMIGTQGEGVAKRFFYYDPNYGLAEFASAGAMKKSLGKLFTDKHLPLPYKTAGSDPTRLEFNVSTHSDAWKKTNHIADAHVQSLLDDALGAKPSVADAAVQPPFKPNSASKPAVQNVEVFMAEAKTLNDPTSILSTNGLGDCSALVVLSDLHNGVYRKRTLVHLNGSNLEAPVGSEHNAFALLQQLDSALENGGKVIFVGGTATRSPLMVGRVIGQVDSNGNKPLLSILQKNDVSVTYASSVGVEVYPDGNFKLRDDEGAGVFDRSKINEILDWARD